MKVTHHLFFKNRHFTAAAVFGGLLFLTQYLAFQRFQINEENEVEKRTQEIHRIENNLTLLLSHSESATRTLAFVVEKYGTVNTFDSLAEVIISSNAHVDAVQLTKNGVITNVYPLRGNESALGFDVLRDAMTRHEALKALTKRKLFFAGPLQLRQSGMGVVGRLPIFKKMNFMDLPLSLLNSQLF